MAAPSRRVTSCSSCGGTLIPYVGLPIWRRCSSMQAAGRRAGIGLPAPRFSPPWARAGGAALAEAVHHPGPEPPAQPRSQPHVPAELEEKVRRPRGPELSVSRCSTATSHHLNSLRELDEMTRGRGLELACVFEQIAGRMDQPDRRRRQGVGGAVSRGSVEAVPSRRLTLS